MYRHIYKKKSSNRKKGSNKSLKKNWKDSTIRVDKTEPSLD